MYKHSSRRSTHWLIPAFQTQLHGGDKRTQLATSQEMEMVRKKKSTRLGDCCLSVLSVKLDSQLVFNHVSITLTFTINP